MLQCSEVSARTPGKPAPRSETESQDFNFMKSAPRPGEWEKPA